MPDEVSTDRKLPRLGSALVVEDDPLQAMALEQALLDGGAKAVTVCASISDAMTALETLRPQILVLDVGLADRDDGWAIAELATALSPRPPRIVFSTGQPEKIPEKVAEMGVILVKPYSPQKLIATLTRPPRKPGLLGRLRSALSE